MARVLGRALRQRLSSQAATAATWLITVGFSLMAAGVAAGGDPKESAVVIRGALGWLSWLGAGGLALAATGRPTTDDEAIESLAALRGVTPREIVWARSWAVGRRILRLLLLPVVLLNLAPLPFVRSWQDALSAASVFLGSLGYLALLAVSVSAVVLAARYLAPARTRLALAGLIFVPELIRSLVSHFPSVPRALSATRDLVVQTGGWVS